jgi:hypothetical protein
MRQRSEYKKREGGKSVKRSVRGRLMSDDDAIGETALTGGIASSAVVEADEGTHLDLDQGLPLAEETTKTTSKRLRTAGDTGHAHEHLQGTESDDATTHRLRTDADAAARLPDVVEQALPHPKAVSHRHHGSVVRHVDDRALLRAYADPLLCNHNPDAILPPLHLEIERSLHIESIPT